MMHHRTRTVAWLVPILVLATLGGCTTMTETYEGVAPDQVWTAMVAVAQNPDYYPDWHIAENEIWSDIDTGRIEVYRTLKRDVVIPMGKAQRQDRTMQHQIWLREDDGEPVIKFVSRHMDIPQRAREEAELYFQDVWEVLGGRPRPAPPMDDDDAEEGLLDVDDLGG